MSAPAPAAHPDAHPPAGGGGGGNWKDKIKGSLKPTWEGVSVRDKLFNFFVKPQGPVGFIAKSPLWMPYYGWQGTKFAAKTGAELAKKTPYYHPTVKTLKTSAAIPEAGFHLLGGPIVEAVKTGFRLTRRGLFNPLGTTAKAMWNIPEAAISQTARTGYEAATSPFKFAASVYRDTLKGILLKAPQQIFKGEIKEAAKTVAWGIGKPVEALARPFYEAVKIPMRVGQEVILSGTEMAHNIGSFYATPAEGIVNGYKSMAKAGKVIAKAKLEFGLEKTKDFRERFKDIFALPNMGPQMIPVGAHAH